MQLCMIRNIDRANACIAWVEPGRQTEGGRKVERFQCETIHRKQYWKIGEKRRWKHCSGKPFTLIRCEQQSCLCEEKKSHAFNIQQTDNNNKKIMVAANKSCQNYAN